LQQEWRSRRLEAIGTLVAKQVSLAVVAPTRDVIGAGKDGATQMILGVGSLEQDEIACARDRADVRRSVPDATESAQRPVPARLASGEDAGRPRSDKYHHVRKFLGKRCDLRAHLFPSGPMSEISSMTIIFRRARASKSKQESTTAAP
jgi:hypothetical protein